MTGRNLRFRGVSEYKEAQAGTVYEGFHPSVLLHNSILINPLIVAPKPTGNSNAQQ